MSFVDKFSDIVRAIENDRGPLVLFGLFVRSDSPNLIDVVVSAKWVNGKSRMDGTRYVVKKITEVLKPKEMLLLSRIVPMETIDSEVRNFVEKVGATDTDNVRDLENFEFAGATIANARIIAAHSGSRISATLSATR